MNYTYNNHLYYTTGGRKFGYRETPYDKYEVFAGKIDKDHFRTSSWRQELRRTADCVLSEYGKDLIVLLSGGTDSEIVVRNFLEIGHKPKCFTLKFKNDYNLPDVEEAIAIAEELDLQLEVIDFDVEDFFWSGEAAEFSKEIDCSQITYLMVYDRIKKLGLPAVMGGEQFLRRQVTPTESWWYHVFRENEDASAMRFSEKFKIPLVNEWFSYTPEMMMYYLTDFEIHELIHTRYNYKLASVSSKNRILRQLYPGIRFKKKTHGFEKLLAFNAEAFVQLGMPLIRRLEPSLDGIEISQLMKDNSL